jgi:hypothetical protein
LVVDKYIALVKKYDKELLVRKTPNFINLADENTKLHKKVSDISSSDEDEHDYDDWPCGICFLTSKESFVIVDCCNQRCHKHCLVHWTHLANFCPFCREGLPKIITALSNTRLVPEATKLCDKGQVLFSSSQNTPNVEVDSVVDAQPIFNSDHSVENGDAASVLGPAPYCPNKKFDLISASIDKKGENAQFDYSEYLDESTESDNDSLLAYSPLRKKKRVLSIQKDPPTGEARKGKADFLQTSMCIPIDDSDVGLNHVLTNQGDKQDKSTNELLRDVHDDMEHACQGNFDGRAAAAEARRKRMLNEASNWCRQDNQAKRMKAAYHKCVPEVVIGDVVTLKVWPNQRAGSSRGILALVFHVSIHKSVHVVTEHGVIGADNPIHYFPPDRYSLNKKEMPIHGKLLRLRTQILSNTFDCYQQPTITVGNCHQAIYGGQIGRAKCTCNPLKGCSSTCKCRKKGLPCSLNCKCMGNCSYNLNLQCGGS